MSDWWLAEPDDFQLGFLHLGMTLFAGYVIYVMLRSVSGRGP